MEFYKPKPGDKLRLIAIDPGSSAGSYSATFTMRKHRLPPTLWDHILEEEEDPEQSYPA